MGYFPCILSWISFSLYPVDLIQVFYQYWKQRLTDDYHVLFYFGVRVEVEDANERIFLWVRCKLEVFPFRIRIGVEDAKSLDLLHDCSLIVQTCLSCCFFFFFFFFFLGGVVVFFVVFFLFIFVVVVVFAFKLMHSAYGEMQWQKLA